MTRKSRKKFKNSSGGKSSKKVSGNHAGGWSYLLEPILYGLGGFILFYSIQPVLNFNIGLTKGTLLVSALFCSCMAIFGNSNFFRNNTARIALITFVFVLVQILVSVALTYGRIEQLWIWKALSSLLAIPIAIVWIFILKVLALSDEPEKTITGYVPRQVFSGYLPSISLFAIMGICVFFIFYRLGAYDIWEDENLVINAAKGVYEQGLSYFKTGYSRAWLHTLSCAGVFHIMGVSEYAGRIPSAFFGIIFLVSAAYVFSRWYGLAWLAILVAAICFLNDRFLILFRYMRMYALLIPVFLIGIYLCHKAIMLHLPQAKKEFEFDWRKKRVVYAIAALMVIILLGHLHKLSIIILPVMACFLVGITVLQKSKDLNRLLLYSLAGVTLLMILAFGMQLEALRMFRQAAERVFSEHVTMTDYFTYVLENGLPRNSTMMVLLSGLGLLISPISGRIKAILSVNYILIGLAVIAMVYVVGNSGRDYRYVAHIVPFVVSSVLYILYHIGKTISPKLYPWIFFILVAFAGIQFFHGYKKVYIRHPWAPYYSVVYASLQEKFTPGDALFAPNIKTYYLDPVALAGEHYHKTPKKKEYSLEQLKADIQMEKRGWYMWELHKSHHWRKEVVEYIYRNFKPIHNSQLDDLGVELFYFDETMIR